MDQIIISPNSYISYDSSFLEKENADELLNYLLTNVEWEQKFYTSYKTGQKIAQPRLTAWFADDPNMAYSYSGITQKVQSWLSPLSDLKEKIEKASGAIFNSVLLNFYRDGSDSVGLHADNEKELGLKPTIASISLGATRTFRMKHNSHAFQTINSQLVHGSLLIMGGNCQQDWKHEVPKEPDISQGRVNLTFRNFYK